jgi:outer membrane protein OmpA-like peptidoglycan-associated protein
MPNAHGEADVEGRKGYIEIKTELKDMPPASGFGPEFMTYVLWAITPEGRPVNLGEVIPGGDNRNVLDVTTDLQAFGLIVTAEPYFAVTQPGDAVVLENMIRPDTKGIVEQVNAKYELLPRGQYTMNVAPTELRPIAIEKHKSLDLSEARNAVRIARWAGADRDATDSMAKAEGLLQQAETYQAKDPGSKPVSTAARGAVQAAEDARLIALKRQDEARLEHERKDAAARELQAKADAIQAEQQRAAAEQQRAAAEQQAERTRKDAEAAQAQAAREKLAAQAQIEDAKDAAAQARREQQQLRQQLAEQFNRILETRETSRGLVVNMSDVLFDIGQWTLKPGAREKLARISAIVGQHPGLKIHVEGHTDSTGSDESNYLLSEKRAEAVRDFLIQQGVNHSEITAIGMGKSDPVASNDNAVGRQLNRRVEMIVSGDIIGQ